MNFIKRIYILLIRKYNASKFGIVFGRAATWTLPKMISYKGKTYTILGDDTKGSGTRDAFRDIFIDDEYGLEYFSKMISISRVIDVGGHSGFFSMCCRLLFPNAIVHSYEPNPALSLFIEHHARGVDFKYFQEAVGGISGKVNLVLIGESINTMTESAKGGEINQVSITECIDRIGGFVDILKLDCEGAEWEILQNKEAFDKVKCITMEFHLINGRTLEELKLMFKTINFKILDCKMTGPAWGMLKAINKKFYS